MEHIKISLERLSKYLGKDVVVKQAIIQALKEVSSIEIKSNSIEIKKSGIFCSVSPMERAILRLKEREIDEHIQKNINKNVGKIN